MELINIINDSKYLVLKYDDLQKALLTVEYKEFVKIIEKIDLYRRFELNKPLNPYLILNRNNNLNLNFLLNSIYQKYPNSINCNNEIIIKVDDISLSLINSIILEENKQS